MPSHSVMSNSLPPHGLQPNRLLCPRDSLGKNTGVGCHFLLEPKVKGLELASQKPRIVSRAENGGPRTQASRFHLPRRPWVAMNGLLGAALCPQQPEGLGGIGEGLGRGELRLSWKPFC